VRGVALPRHHGACRRQCRQPRAQRANELLQIILSCRVTSTPIIANSGVRLSRSAVGERWMMYPASLGLLDGQLQATNNRLGARAIINPSEAAQMTRNSGPSMPRGLFGTARLLQDLVGPSITLNNSTTERASLPTHYCFINQIERSFEVFIVDLQGCRMSLLM
jgi:hypothetical protein